MKSKKKKENKEDEIDRWQFNFLENCAYFWKKSGSPVKGLGFHELKYYDRIDYWASSWHAFHKLNYKIDLKNTFIYML